MSVAEKLTEIAENVPKVYDAGFANGEQKGYEAGYQAGSSTGGEIDESLFANALKGTANGVSIFLEDASPFAHTAKVKLNSKNLHPSLAGWLSYDDSEDQNITITETDGHPTINGTYTHTELNYGEVGFGDSIDLKKGRTYTISVKRFGGEIVEGALTLLLVGESFATDGINITNDQPEGVPQSFVAPRDESVCISVFTDDGTVFDNFTFDVQVEEGATATAYTPFIADPTAVAVVMRDGKNLFDPSIIPEETTYEGVVLTRNGDEIYLGYEHEQPDTPISILRDLNRCLYLPDLVGEDLVLTIFAHGDNLDGYGEWQPCIYTSDRIDGEFELLSTDYLRDSDTVFTCNFVLDKPYLQLVFYVPGSYFTSSFKIQLEQGDVSTEYEPCATKLYPVAEDGTCEVPIAANTAMTTDTPGVALECEYAQDTNKVVEKLINAIISMGGNV